MNLLKIRSLLLILLLATGRIFAQNTNNDLPDLDHGYLMLSGGVGSTNHDISNFDNVFTDQPLDKVAIVAVGARSAAIVGKFREFRASGQSTVKNVQATGAAKWYQRYWEAGLRFRSDKMPFYMDVLYFLTTAREDISTVADPIPALAVSYGEKQRGIAVALGMAVTIVAPVRLFGEAEYGMVIKKETQDGTPSSAPDLGGFRLAGGAQIAF